MIVYFARYFGVDKTASGVVYTHGATHGIPNKQQNPCPNCHWAAETEDSRRHPTKCRRSTTTWQSRNVHLLEREQSCMLSPKVKFKAHVEQQVDVRSHEVSTEDWKIFKRNSRYLRNSLEPMPIRNYLQLTGTERPVEKRSNFKPSVSQHQRPTTEVPRLLKRQISVPPRNHLLSQSSAVTSRPPTNLKDIVIIKWQFTDCSWLSLRLYFD